MFPLLAKIKVLSNMAAVEAKNIQPSQKFAGLSFDFTQLKMVIIDKFKIAEDEIIRTNFSFIKNDFKIN
jgi:hypothetical protein